MQGFLLCFVIVGALAKMIGNVLFSFNAYMVAPFFIQYVHVFGVFMFNGFEKCNFRTIFCKSSK